MVATLVEHSGNRWPGPQRLGDILPAVLARLGVTPVDPTPPEDATGDRRPIELLLNASDAAGKNPRSHHSP
jgi:hypothetical protein